MKSYVLTVSCDSQRGVVAAISTYLAEHGCNITDSSQFDDQETGLFFMRVAFVSEEGVDQETLAKGFEGPASELGMTYEIHDSSEKMKVLLKKFRMK